MPGAPHFCVSHMTCPHPMEFLFPDRNIPRIRIYQSRPHQPRTNYSELLVFISTNPSPRQNYAMIGGRVVARCGGGPLISLATVLAITLTEQASGGNYSM